MMKDQLQDVDDYNEGLSLTATKKFNGLIPIDIFKTKQHEMKQIVEECIESSHVSRKDHFNENISKVF